MIYDFISANVIRGSGYQANGSSKVSLPTCIIACAFLKKSNLFAFHTFYTACMYTVKMTKAFDAITRKWHDSFMLTIVATTMIQKQRV